MRVLITGMSGTGKSTLVRELRRRGELAYDADEDGFNELRADGRWEWRADRVAALLAADHGRPLFFAGCSEEQATLPFDVRVLLTVPRELLVERLRTRTTNAYGRDPAELALVLADLDAIEPALRRSADLVLIATAPPAELADRVRAHLVTAASRASPDCAPSAGEPRTPGSVRGPTRRARPRIR